MKTPLENPDALFRQAKAALKGIPLRELMTDALAEKLRASEITEKSWMECVGQLRGLRHETARINKIIEEDFRRIEPEDRL